MTKTDEAMAGVASWLLVPLAIGAMWFAVKFAVKHTNSPPELRTYWVGEYHSAHGDWKGYRDGEGSSCPTLISFGWGNPNGRLVEGTCVTEQRYD